MLLPNGKVLIVGGGQTTRPGYGVSLNTAELHDPDSGEFSIIGTMVARRSGHKATLLNNGKVLITGGAGNKAELFDPVTGTFSATGDMTTSRRSHSATLLPNGQVLLVGGYTAAGPVTTNSVELYNPATGTFSSTANMAEARQQHTATLLLTGELLVVGGSEAGTELSSAELFYIKPAPTPAPPPTPSYKLIYEDDFSNPNSGWSVMSELVSETYYSEGEYHILVKTYNWSDWEWNQLAGRFADFVLEIDARLVSGHKNVHYGLVFRLEDHNDFYRFLVGGDGFYRVGTKTAGMWTTLAKGTRSAVIKGGNGTNHLKVVCKGSQIKAYVNGHHLTTITDNSFTEGYVGMIVYGPEPDCHVAFDNIKVYSLD